MTHITNKLSWFGVRDVSNSRRYTGNIHNKQRKTPTT